MHKKPKPKGFPYASAKSYATTLRLFTESCLYVSLDFASKVRKPEKLPVVLSKGKIDKAEITQKQGFIPSGQKRLAIVLTISKRGALDARSCYLGSGTSDGFRTREKSPIFAFQTPVYG